MTFGEKLKIARKKKNLTQDLLAKLIGVSRVAITNYEKGNNEPTYENVKKLSTILETDFSNEEKPVKLVPVVGNASCGSCDLNTMQDLTRKAYYNGEFWKETLYCVIANGDSMAPDIEDGDEIIIDPDVRAITGDMVHYKIGDESAIKVLVVDEDAHIVQFIPYNQDECFRTKTFRMDDDSFNDLMIHKVVSVNKLKFNNRAARLKMIGR